MKIEVHIDLDDYIGRWDNECLAGLVEDEVKAAVLSKLKSSDKFKKIVDDKYEALLESL